MENNEDTKHLFFKRIILAFKKSTDDLISRSEIGLALSDGYPEEFYKIKGTTAFAIISWSAIKEDNTICEKFLKRILDTKLPEDLQTVIEEFMEYTGFQANLPDGWPYED